MFGNLYDVGAEYETHREVVTLRDAPSEDDENDGITSRETTSVAPQFSRRCFARSAPAGSNSAWNTVSGSCAGNSARKTWCLRSSPSSPRGGANAAGGSERLRRRFRFRGGGGGSGSTGKARGVGTGGSARVVGGAARCHASRTHWYAFSRYSNEQNTKAWPESLSRTRIADKAPAEFFFSTARTSARGTSRVVTRRNKLLWNSSLGPPRSPATTKSLPCSKMPRLSAQVKLPKSTSVASTSKASSSHDAEEEKRLTPSPGSPLPRTASADGAGRSSLGRCVSMGMRSLSMLRVGGSEDVNEPSFPSLSALSDGPRT